MKILKTNPLIAASVLLSMTFGCSTEEGPAPQRETVAQEDIVFSASVNQETGVTDERVTVTVTHNGSDRETYCVFCYDNPDETPLENAILRKIAEIASSDGGFSSALTNGNTHVSIISGLEDDTEYRFVVFGLNSDGTTYGTPASVNFTTAKSPLEFSVSVSGITETSAKASVTSTGDEKDTWYCFRTEDVTTPLESLISSTVESLSDGFELKSGNAEIEFSGLTPGTEYRVVVTGLNADKEISGTPGSAMFMTTPAFAEETGWNVTYGGKKLESEGEYAGYYYESFDVTTVDTDRWFDIALDEAFYMSQFSGDPEQAIAYYVGYYNSLIESIGQDPQTVWGQLSYTGSRELSYDVMEDGDYVMIVAGVTINGNANGKYKTVEFTTDVTAIDATAEYKAWLGSWRLEDADKTGFDISVVPYVNTADARGYLMFGYENTGSQFPVQLLTGENNSLQFITSENLGNVQFSDGSSGVLGFYGLGTGSNFYGGTYAAANASLNPGGNSATVTAGTVNTESGQVQLTKMQYIAEISGQYSMITDPDTVPGFPLTMTKASGTQDGTSAAGNGLVMSRAAGKIISSAGASFGIRTYSPVAGAAMQRF